MSGAYDADKKQTYVSVEADNGGGTGLFGAGARRETYVDAGSITSAVDGELLTKSKYIAQLSQKGKEKLRESTELISFEGTVDITAEQSVPLSMGDIVQLVNEYDIELRARVIELVHSQDESGESTYPTFQSIPLLSDVSPQVVVTGPFSGTAVIAISDGTVVTGIEDQDQWLITLPNYGEWTIIATLGSEVESTTITVTSSTTYTVSLVFRRIYGSSWGGGPGSTWSRTNDSMTFLSPTPAIGVTGGSSPFDTLYPWKGMIKEVRNNNVMVKIPKYWFKWTKIGSILNLQIANKDTEGFFVSPAHADRHDGRGERDVVYIGRYHCNSSYVSTTGGFPVVSVSRLSARTNIHNTGSTLWQMDYAMFQTIRMLYLVEFAGWDSQGILGKGCGNGSGIQTMGYTDIMPYHTGTVLSSRDTYGLGIQYRGIEGLWDNVFDWMDGCYYNASGLNVILDPHHFSDASNGTVLGLSTSGYPKEMTASPVAGFEWATYPTRSDDSDSTYIPDYWDAASGPCLFTGGNFNHSKDYGLFYTGSAPLSHTSGNIGCRLQELP